MKVTREFCPADRYVYDWGACSYKNGYAQVDTDQDAPYFGTWANPATLTIVNYCEGDVTIQEAADTAEFAAAIREAAEWNAKMGYSYHIDPMCVPEIEAAFREAGLGDLLH